MLVLVQMCQCKVSNNGSSATGGRIALDEDAHLLTNSSDRGIFDDGRGRFGSVDWRRHDREI